MNRRAIFITETRRRGEVRVSFAPTVVRFADERFATNYFCGILEASKSLNPSMSPGLLNTRFGRIPMRSAVWKSKNRRGDSRNFSYIFHVASERPNSWSD